MIYKSILALLVSLFFLNFQSQPALQDPDKNLVSFFSSKAVPFASADELNILTGKAGERQLVLLGEASHGTHEYYHWRAEISKQLIAVHGFNFIAVEGDWASVYRLNQYVKGLDEAASSAREVLQSFSRWPEWMWANTDILDLAEWLKEYNEKLPRGEKLGFYGMDVYGQWEAMENLIGYTQKHLPGEHEEIELKLNCFSRFGKDEWQYARMVTDGHKSCEEDLQSVIEILHEHEKKLTQAGDKAFFRAVQNALVMQNAESFYRLALQNRHESWNSRVDHMWLTIERLLDFSGENAKGIVWAHNTHVGDSRATNMSLAGQYNIGALSRTHLGEENVFIVGFGTQKGKVNGGRSWGATMQIMNVPRAKKGSLDYYLGQVPHHQFFVVFGHEDKEHPLLSEPLGHRAIGVVYNPRNEEGNYVPTLPARRYNALIFFQETVPLTPVQ